MLDSELASPCDRGLGLLTHATALGERREQLAARWTPARRYEYRYSVADNVGNRTIYARPDIAEAGTGPTLDPLDPA